MVKKKIVQPAAHIQLRRIENTLRNLNQTLLTQQEEHRKALEEIKIDVTDIRERMNRRGRRKLPLFSQRASKERGHMTSKQPLPSVEPKVGMRPESNQSNPLGNLLQNTQALQGLDLSKVISLLKDPTVQSLLKHYTQKI